MARRTASSGAVSRERFDCIDRRVAGLDAHDSTRRSSHDGLARYTRLRGTLISAVAIKAGTIPVLHSDTDFHVLARHTQLRVGEP
jgi:hypothetical protein